MLASQYGFSTKAIYNCGLARANWLYLAQLEREGAIKLLTNEVEREVHEAAALEGLVVMRFAPGAGPPAAVTTNAGPAEGPSGLPPEPRNADSTFERLEPDLQRPLTTGGNDAV